MGFRSLITGMGGVQETSPGVFTTTGGLAEDIVSLPNDILLGGAVTGGMEVTATSPASNQVNISAGKAWVENDAYVVGSQDQKFWPVNNDAAAQITIPANSTGNPRIVLVCVKVDPTQVPGDDAAPICSYETVVGTSAPAPVAPAVPAKHTVLAQVYCANNFTSITSGNITDRRVKPNALPYFTNGVRAYGGAPINITPTMTNISYDTVDFQRGITWNGVTATITRKGIYTINGLLSLSPINQGDRLRYSLIKNGVRMYSGNAQRANVGNVFISAHISCELLLEVGDTIETNADITSGSVALTSDELARQFNIILKCVV